MKMDELLARLGCTNIPATQARFLDDVNFYRDIALEALADPAFEELATQLDAHDTATAFDTAHMLKGVVSNCGLTPLFDAIVALVEPLRGGQPDYSEMQTNYQLMLAQRDAALRILSAAA